MDFTAVIKTLEEQLAANEAERDRLFAKAGALMEAIKALRSVTSLEAGCPKHGVDRNMVSGLKSPLANAGMF